MQNFESSFVIGIGIYSSNLIGSVRILLFVVTKLLKEASLYGNDCKYSSIYWGIVAKIASLSLGVVLIFSWRDKILVFYVKAVEALGVDLVAHDPVELHRTVKWGWSNRWRRLWYPWLVIVIA